MNSLGGTLEKQGRKTRRKKSLERLAEKFAGNLPKVRQAKMKSSPHIRSAEPRHEVFLSQFSPILLRRGVGLLR